eukprot:COSAG01_NODE_18014_length_1105_cov_3.555666_1_plen_140_part_10
MDAHSCLVLAYALHLLPCRASPCDGLDVSRRTLAGCLVTLLHEVCMQAQVTTQSALVYLCRRVHMCGQLISRLHRCPSGITQLLLLLLLCWLLLCWLLLHPTTCRLASLRSLDAHGCLVLAYALHLLPCRASPCDGLDVS